MVDDSLPALRTMVRRRRSTAWRQMFLAVGGLVGLKGLELRPWSFVGSKTTRMGTVMLMHES